MAEILPLPEGTSLRASQDIIQNNFSALAGNCAAATAPANPVAGQLWYDTTLFVPKVYTGTSFVPLAPRYVTFTVGHADLTAAATTEAITLLTAGTKYIVRCLRQKTTTAFSGGGAASVTCSIGDSGSATRYGAAYDCFAAVSNTNFQAPGTAGAASSAATAILATFTADVNVAALTAGALEITLEITYLP